MPINEKDEMLMEIMALCFSAYDLLLYLDTHPCDARAVDYFNLNTKKARALKDEYQKKYGPLSPDFDATVPWQWIDSPWPWDMNERGVKHVGV